VFEAMVLWLMPETMMLIPLMLVVSVLKTLVLVLELVVLQPLLSEASLFGTRVPASSNDTLFETSYVLS
jgi:hypothetical protein